MQVSAELADPLDGTKTLTLTIDGADITSVTVALANGGPATIDLNQLASAVQSLRNIRADA